MGASWVAVHVRALALAERRLPASEVARLAGLSRLDDALGELKSTPYGKPVQPGMDLAAAEHGLWSTLVWHMRILAGWAPPAGAERARVLAGRFDVANVVAHLARLEGRPAQGGPMQLSILQSGGGQPPFMLGSLGSAWPAVSAAHTPEEVRRALKSSGWGDPGVSGPGGVALALGMTWLRRVAEAVPEAAGWATARGAMKVAAAMAAGVNMDGDSQLRRDSLALLGARSAGASSMDELRRSLRRSDAWILEGIDSFDDLWKAELRWWARMQADAWRMLGASRPGPGSLVGAVGALAADAWSIQAALELAARGGGTLPGVSGAGLGMAHDAVA